MQHVTLIISIFLTIVVVAFITMLRVDGEDGTRKANPVASTLRRRGIRPWHLFLAAAVGALVAILINGRERGAMVSAPEAPYKGVEAQAPDTIGTVFFDGKTYYVLSEGEGRLIMAPLVKKAKKSRK